MKKLIFLTVLIILSCNVKAEISKDSTMTLIFESYNRGDYDSTVSLCSNLEKRYKEEGDIINLTKIIYSKGSCYRSLEKYPEALKEMLFALSQGDSLKDLKMINKCCNEIAHIYIILGDDENFKKFVDRALEAGISDNHTAGLIATYNVKLTYYYEKENYDSAAVYAHKVLTMEQSLGDTSKIIRARGNLSAMYIELNQYQKAIDQCQAGLTTLDLYSKNQPDSHGDLYTLLYGNMADALNKNNKPAAALTYAMKALDLSQKRNTPNSVIKDLLHVSQIYENLGNYKQANHYKDLYIVLKDSIYNESRTKVLAEMDRKYESSKKEKQIVELTAEQQRKRIINYFLIGIVVLVVLMLSIAVYSFIQKKKANIIIEHKNKEITESVTYAQRIQRAMLPSRSKLKEIIEGFVLFKPKDIVSGDFYWFKQSDKGMLISAADCTGHGVPGSMVSMLGMNCLEQITDLKVISSPGHILTELNDQIQRALKSKELVAQDGMDIALCRLNEEKTRLDFAGALRSLYLVRDGEIITYKSDKVAIGGYTPSDYKFSTQQIDVQKGDAVYIFSDGYADQFGGPKGKKLMMKRMKELMIEASTMSAEAQKEHLDTAFENWRGNLEQVDDICVVGFKI